MPYSRPGNGVLNHLHDDDLALLTPHLEPVALPRLMRLEERGRGIEHVYFPDDGVASVVARNLDGGQLEVALIGREGVTGTAVMLTDGRAANEIFMQVAGHGRRLPSALLRACMAQSERLRAVLLRYVHTFMVSMAHTAVAHGRSTIEERLARWLLMAHDRIEGDAVPLTHEFLAIMLGVRRPGVTVALKRLEERGPIRRVRRTIEIADRDGLKKAANGAYGAPEAEFTRLFEVWKAENAACSPARTAI